MKKLKIGMYILMLIGIIGVITKSYIFDKKDSLEVTSGEKVYRKQCLDCHGETGKGEGSKAGTAINNQHFLSIVSNRDLYNYVKFGREGTAMLAYGSRLSEIDLNHLVAFMRNWQKDQIDLAVPKKKNGNIEYGEKLYNLYCFNCHGKAGVGKSKMGTAVSNPRYLKYTSDLQIWLTIAYGREETRMGPSLKGLEGARQLKKDDITDIVSYIRSLQIK